MPHRVRLMMLASMFAWRALSAQAPSTACSTTLTRRALCTMGPHAVGFERSWSLDSSRPWPANRPSSWSASALHVRPVRVDIWYPAQQGTGAAMRFGDLTALRAPGGESAEAQRLITTYDVGSLTRYASGDSVRLRRLWDAPLESRRGARWAAGRFPLILYSAGWYNRSPDNLALLEHLASRGFVVVTVPQFNPALWSGDFRSTPSAIESQLRDVEHALAHALRLAHVDPTRIIAMGFSTGGLVALELAGRNSWIGAVVALDPSFTGDDGEGAAVALASPWVGLRRNVVPLLVLTKDTTRAGRRVVDSLRLAPRLHGVLPEATHGDFSDQAWIDQVLGGEATSGATAGPSARVLRGIIEAAPLMMPALGRARAAASGSVALELLAPSRAPSPHEWSVMAARVGAEATRDTLRRLEADAPGLTIVDERSLNAAAYAQLRNGTLREAIELFRFTALAFPGSANAHDSLLDGLLAARDQQGAQAVARHLLSLIDNDTTLPDFVKVQMRDRAREVINRR